MKPLLAVLAVGLVVAAAIAAQTPASVQQAPAEGAWLTFEGTLSASGEIQTLLTEGGEPAATFQLSGVVWVAAGEGLGKGFRGEVIGFTDAGTLAGRAVWTDGHGDRIFSSLKGEPFASGRRVAGTFTGGTGRYAGITGDYAFEWQYVVSAEAGTLSGRSVGLRGRFRHGGGER